LRSEFDRDFEIGYRFASETGLTDRISGGRLIPFGVDGPSWITAMSKPIGGAEAADSGQFSMILDDEHFDPMFAIHSRHEAL